MGIPEHKDLPCVADQFLEINSTDVLSAGVDASCDRVKAGFAQLGQRQIVPQSVKVKADEPAMVRSFDSTGEDACAVAVAATKLDDHVRTKIEAECMELQALQNAQVARFVDEQPDTIELRPERDCRRQLPVKA